jgi:hypothetical protein
MSAREIGIELNCTAVAVRSRAFRLNLLERKPVVSQIGTWEKKARAEGEDKMNPSTPTRQPWTVDEQKKLDELLKAGKTGPEIATALQRTCQAVYGRLQRLDVKRMRSSRRIIGHC